jgi:predicted dehydrogenase
MKIIRWGIIGCGDVTEIKSGPGFQKANNSSLVAVMRRNAGLAQDYARRHGVPKWYADAQTLIADPEVDAVYVATPPAFHKQYALLSARAGKPAYVEKPMALNFEDCQEMLQAFRLAGVPLFVAYYRRALPRFLKVKELVKSGAIGKVRYVSMVIHKAAQEEHLTPDELPWRVMPEMAGGGHFVDLASHTLDFMDYVLGPIGSVRGFAANQGNFYTAEDIVAGTFRFESGVHGVGMWSFATFDSFDMNEIVGSKGKVSFSTLGVEPVILTTQQSSTPFPIDNPPHVQQPLVQTIVDELNGMGRCPSTGESAARTSWVMDELLRDYRWMKKSRI